MTTDTKNCRHCSQPIAVSAAMCDHCGGKQTGGSAPAIIIGLLILAIAGGLVAESLYPAEQASPLDVEAAQRLAGMEELHDRIAGMGITRDLPALHSRKPGNFAGVNLLCGRLTVPQGKYDRVIIAHGEAQHDSPMQGEWFDHVWQRAGCD